MNLLKGDDIAVLDTAIAGKLYHWVDKVSKTKIESDGFPGIDTELHRGQASECPQNCKERAKFFGMSRHLHNALGVQNAI